MKDLGTDSRGDVSPPSFSLNRIVPIAYAIFSAPSSELISSLGNIIEINLAPSLKHHFNILSAFVATLADPD